MITIDPDAGTITYTRNANMVNGQFYNYATLLNADGSQDLVKVPVESGELGFFSASNIPSASYPPNPPWQIEEIYVSFSQDSGAPRSYADGFHRTNTGSWDHFGADPSILLGVAWVTDAEFKMCSSVSVSTSAWVYGLDATNALKIDSAVITVDKAKLRAAYPELDTGGRVRVAVSVYGYRAPCNIRLSGSSSFVIGCGGEVLATSKYLTLTPDTEPQPDPMDRWQRDDVTEATFDRNCVAVATLVRGCP